MPNYKITITPLLYYFFGGEKHDTEYKTNYFVESLDYPQQTTLLGMLRYFLLQKNSLLNGKSIEKQKKAGELIGEQSFKYGESYTFGEIKSLSPLYFTKDGKDYHFAPMDIGFELENDFQLYYKGKPYNAKDHWCKIGVYLISEDEEIILLSDVIKSITQVGNEKGDGGGSKDEAFYKQTMKRLVAGWSFAINAEIDLEIEPDEFKVQLGGEKCMFNLHFEETEIKTIEYPKKHQRVQKTIVCLSDCFIDGSKIKELEFAVSDYISFRNFRSQASTKNFYDFKKEQNIEEGMVRSSRYQLLKRGSVLYFADTQSRDKFSSEIEKDSARNIGFNQILKN